MTALLMMKGIAEIATSMTTTPLTVCVKILRREARRRVKTDWSRVEATTKLANKPGPPTWSAKAQTAKKGTLKFATMRRPEPKWPQPEGLQDHAGSGDCQRGKCHP